MTHNPQNRTRPFFRLAATGLAVSALTLGATACSDDDGNDDDIDNPVDGVDDQLDDGLSDLESEIDSEVTEP